MKKNIEHKIPDKLNKSQLYFVESDKSIGFFQYNGLLKMLSLQKQEQILKYHFEVDKKLTLISHILVRYLACNLLGMDNSEIEFQKNVYGKPFIVDKKDFHFNISHTRNAFVIGVSKEPIGVDIEKIKEYEEGIVNRFFTFDEAQYINKDNEEKTTRFYEIWTRKESYIKWVGTGLAIPLNSFDVVTYMPSCKFSSLQIGPYQISACHSKDIITSVIDLREKKVYEAIQSLCKSQKQCDQIAQKDFI